MAIREAQVAGLFYDADPVLLARQVDSLLAAAACELVQLGRVPAFAPMALLPHAGHIYCGSIIARTLARMQPPERLLILCPHHTGQGTGAGLAIWPEGAWRTPLGDLAIDTELATALLATDGGYTVDRLAHSREHAIEVLLPFIQRWAPAARIVPIVVSAAPSLLARAGAALAHVVSLTAGLAQALEGEAQGRAERDNTTPFAASLGCRTSVLISSDMHHFGDEATTRHLDMLALAHLMALDPAGLWNTVVREKISMCGVAPAVLGLYAAQSLGVTRMELVAHSSSADVSGDTARVVGYAGAVFACGLGAE